MESQPNPVFRLGRATRAFNHHAALQLANDHPQIDAAACFNDLVAMGMLFGFAKRGKHVGKGFRLVVFDDIEQCAQACPQWTSVCCDIFQSARQTANTLLRWMKDGKRPQPEMR
jgi:LacI family transcriptional regulator